MTNSYEVLMLSVPEITQDETKQIENELDKLINNAKGKVSSFERWGKFKLTYPIRKNEYGVYFLARFDTEDASTLLKDMQSLFRVKLNDLIVRHMTTRLTEDQLGEYQRPKSLEETPASRDMDSFLKENKMEGLLSMDSKDKKRSAKSAAQAQDTDVAVEQEKDTTETAQEQSAE